MNITIMLDTDAEGILRGFWAFNDGDRNCEVGAYPQGRPDLAYAVVLAPSGRRGASRSVKFHPRDVAHMARFVTYCYEGHISPDWPASSA